MPLYMMVIYKTRKILNEKICRYKIYEVMFEAFGMVFLKPTSLSLLFVFHVLAGVFSNCLQVFVVSPKVVKSYFGIQQTLKKPWKVQNVMK